MRYYGGKTRQGSVVSKHINKCVKGTDYYDLFCGGLGVSSRVAGARSLTLNDLNQPLIKMYEFIIRNNYIISHSEEIRTEAVANSDHPLHAMFTIGLQWGGRYGTGVGLYGKTYSSGRRNYTNEFITSTTRKLRKLVDPSFTNHDYNFYSNVINSTVYLDPPYHDVDVLPYLVDCSEFNTFKFVEFANELSENNVVFITHNKPEMFNRNFTVIHDFGNTNAMSSKKEMLEYLLVSK